jgi:hypothetical protein
VVKEKGEGEREEMGREGEEGRVMVEEGWEGEEARGR